MEKQVCCICGEEFTGFGNNPWPIKEDGQCCDKCNEQVIIARIINAYDKQKESE